MVLSTADEDGNLVTELGSRNAGEKEEVVNNVRNDDQHVHALERAFAANPQLSERDTEEIAKEGSIDIVRVKVSLLIYAALQCLLKSSAVVPKQGGAGRVQEESIRSLEKRLLGWAWME